MYPYVLGIHFKSSFLCRLPHPLIADFIPVGFGRIIRYRQYARFKERAIVFSGPKINPYFGSNIPISVIARGDIDLWQYQELEPRYMSLFRWSDLQRRYNEPVTGPVMLKAFLTNANQLDR